MYKELWIFGVRVANVSLSISIWFITQFINNDNISISYPNSSYINQAMLTGPSFVCFVQCVLHIPTMHCVTYPYTAVCVTYPYNAVCVTYPYNALCYISLQCSMCYISLQCSMCYISLQRSMCYISLQCITAVSKGDYSAPFQSSFYMNNLTTILSKVTVSSSNLNNDNLIFILPRFFSHKFYKDNLRDFKPTGPILGTNEMWMYIPNSSALHNFTFN